MIIRKRGTFLSKKTDLTSRLAVIKETTDRLYDECSHESGKDLQEIVKELCYQVSYLAAIVHKHLEGNER